MNRRTIRGIHFLRLRGTLPERLQGHARLLRAEVIDGALTALVKKNEWLIRRSPGLLQFSPLADVVVKAYRKFLVPAMGRNMKEAERAAVQLAAKETGLPYEDALESLFQADAMMLLARTSMMKHLLPEWIPGGLPGCTSAVTLKGWTQSGRLLACRNLDYPLVGPWEKHPAVMFNEPTETGDIPYVSLGTAGVPFGGITSINREGLTLFTHAHFGREVSFCGRPIVLIGDEIIRKARSLDEAIDLARKSKTVANWSFVMASAKENQAIVIEMTPSKVKVRSSEDGFIAHTNYFHDPALQREEALLSGTYCEDLKGRFCRIRQLLEQHRGKLEPAHMAVTMGDHTDYFTGQERVFGNTISVITTVKSAVFDPGSQKFWMAARQESPVGLGDFIEVDIDRFWSQSAEEYEQTMTVLPGYQPKTPGLLEAIHYYREAYRCFHMNSHEPDYLTQAFFHLQKAVKACPTDGHMWVQAGLLAFKLHKFEEAEAFLEKSRACVLSEHVGAVRDLYVARCLDLKGLRKKALKLYQARKQVQEPKLAKAFRTGMKRKYRSFETARIVVDLHFPDTFQY